MKTVRLERFESSDHGTFGRLIVDDLVLFTGELPYRDVDGNGVTDSYLSCIPAGKYTVRFTFSNRFKKRMYLVGPVLGRTGIRIHSANRMGDSKKGFVADLLGCIALGERIGWIGQQKALLVSKPAVRRFEKHMEEKPFTLEIIECSKT